MSLTGFQRAMADAVTSPALCRAMRDADPEVLAGYDLTERERRRVVAVAGQPGMTVNSTLYWGNRLALLMRTMPLTCRALGGDLPAVATRYWADAPYALLQFRAEAVRFAAHVRDRLADGELDPLVADTVAVDLAVLAMRLSPDEAGTSCRVLRVSSDVDAIVGGGSGVPSRAPAGDQWLLVETSDDQIRIGRVDAAAASRLADTAPSPGWTPPSDLVTVLHLGALTPATP